MATPSAMPKSQSGVVLLEALIALLVFAIGILGMVGMQASATRATADGKVRAEAVMYADELLSSMWAGDRSNGNLVAQYASPNGTRFQAWRNELTGGTGQPGLPGVTVGQNAPTVEIAVNPDGGSDVTISIFWQGPSDQAAHKYVTVTQII
jgi:type IV pilus assembly protein PilV